MHRDPHDDALRHSSYRVFLPVVGSVEQVVGSLLEAGQHQDGLLHLGETMPGDAEDLPPAGHQVGQQHDVPDVDAHPVGLHGVLHLVHDSRPGGLDAQRARHLQSVVGGRRLAVHALSGEDLPEVVSWL